MQPSNTYQPKHLQNPNRRMPRQITPEKATLPEYRGNEERPSVRSNSEMMVHQDKQVNSQHISKSKPKITSAKSKPFDVRDTPKKSNDSAPNPLKPSKQSYGHESSPAEKKDRARSKFASDNTRNVRDDNNGNGAKQRPSKFEEEEPRSLSNTHVFDKNNGSIAAVSNEQSRKSMNNLHLLKDQKKLTQERSHKSVSKQPSKQQAKQDAKQPVKPPINTSSSQSSLGSIPGIMDLGAQKTQMTQKKQSQHIMKPHEEKRHETIVVQKQQKTKPLIGKQNSNIIRRHDTMNSFGEESSQDPTLTANTLVPQQLQTESEASSKKSLSNLSNIRVEKQDSSEASEADDESDEEEFPVALNGLVFSFLPPEVAEKLNDQSEWKNRVSALQETENLIK